MNIHVKFSNIIIMSAAFFAIVFRTELTAGLAGLSISMALDVCVCNYFSFPPHLRIHYLTYNYTVILDIRIFSRFCEEDVRVGGEYYVHRANSRIHRLEARGW